MRISDWSSDVCSSDLSSCTSIARFTVESSANGVWLGHKVISEAPLSRTRLAVINKSLERPDWEMQIATSVGFNVRSEEHTSELQSLMRISYAVFCLKKKTTTLHQLLITLENVIQNTI